MLGQAEIRGKQEPGPGVRGPGQTSPQGLLWVCLHPTKIDFEATLV